MKAIELIRLLQDLDPEVLVVINGYEGGYNDVKGVTTPRTFIEEVNQAWYYGPHELDTDYFDQEEVKHKPRFEAVTIY